jgi:hypothetical protein
MQRRGASAIALQKNALVEIMVLELLLSRQKFGRIRVDQEFRSSGVRSTRAGWA